MRFRIPVLTLALLCLCGCSSLLNRSYRQVRSHVTTTVDSSESEDILRAENYGELVNAVQFFVSQQRETGTIHVYGYPGTLESDLEAVCQELLTQDPLCCWALDDIQWSRSPMISYDECVFTFAYRIEPAEIAQVEKVVGSGAIRAKLAQAMSQFERRTVFLTTAYYAREDLLLQLCQQAYYTQPGYAMGYPQAEVKLYPPDAGHSPALVEVLLDYTASDALLRNQASKVAASAAKLVGTSPAQGQVGCWLLYSRLAQLDHYAPQGKSSVYAALVAGNSNSEGIALAYQFLCQQSGIECMLVSGTLDNVPHCWNLVSIDGEWYHLDVTTPEDQQHFLRGDREMKKRYVWDTEQYPACPVYVAQDATAVE